MHQPAVRALKALKVGCQPRIGQLPLIRRPLPASPRQSTPPAGWPPMCQATASAGAAAANPYGPCFGQRQPLAQVLLEAREQLAHLVHLDGGRWAVAFTGAKEPHGAREGHEG